MQGKIIARLKEGSIKNVLPFGSESYGLPPYVVVKLENGPGRINVRIILRIEQGAQQLYRNYLFSEVSDLLKDWRATDEYGNTFILWDSGDWSEVSALTDDNTLSMERIFYVPFRPR